jgi:hypothetical protein
MFAGELRRFSSGRSYIHSLNMDLSQKPKLVIYICTNKIAMRMVRSYVRRCYFYLRPLRTEKSTHGTKFQHFYILAHHLYPVRPDSVPPPARKIPPRRRATAPFAVAASSRRCQVRVLQTCANKSADAGS